MLELHLSIDAARALTPAMQPIGMTVCKTTTTNNTYTCRSPFNTRLAPQPLAPRQFLVQTSASGTLGDSARCVCAPGWLPDPINLPGGTAAGADKA